MKRLAISLLLLLGSTHCGPRAATAITHAPLSQTSGLAAHARPLAVRPGHQAAVATVEALLLALRDGDGAGVTRCFASEPIQLGHSNGLTTTRVRQDLAVHRVLGAWHASTLPSEMPLDAIIDRSSLATTTANRHFRGVPRGLRDEDVVVTFRVRPVAERALLAFALRGVGLLVVRVAADGARIIAL